MELHTFLTRQQPTAQAQELCRCLSVHTACGTGWRTVLIRNGNRTAIWAQSEMEFRPMLLWKSGLKLRLYQGSAFILKISRSFFHRLPVDSLG